MDDIVKRYSKGKGTLVPHSNERNTKTVIFAVPRDASQDPIPLRTYSRASHGPDELELSDEISISDAAVAVTAARGLFQPASLNSASQQAISILDKTYPSGLINPTKLIWDEICNLPEFEPQIESILSIGCGRPADADIPYLLALGVSPTHPTFIRQQGQRILQMLRNLVKGKSSGEKATQNAISRLDQLEKDIAESIPFEVYRRLEMPSVPDVGPNDFLNLEDVDSAAQRLLESIQLRLSASLLRGGHQSALNWAACTGNYSAVKKYLDQKPESLESSSQDVDSEDGDAPYNDGRSPLHWAADNGHPNIIRLLLEARSEQYGSRAEQNLLRDPATGTSKSANVSEILTPFELAAKKGHVEVLEVFSRRQEQLDTFPEDDLEDPFLGYDLEHRFSRDVHGIPHLASPGHRPMFSPVRRAHSQLITREELQKALVLSIEYKHRQVMDCLSEKFGMDFTQLETTQHVRLLDSYRELLEQKFGTGKLLHLASQRDNVELVENLLKFPTNIDSRNDDNETALHVAIHSRSKRVVKLLLEKEADTNCQNDGGESALMLAIRKEKGDPERRDIVQLLLQSGADIERKNIEGETPLVLAMRLGRGNLNLAFCIRRRDGRLAEQLCRASLETNQQTKEDKTVMRLAAVKGYHNVLEMFLEAGADLKKASRKGSTMLHLGVESKSPETVRLLVRERIPLEEKTVDGETALHSAATLGCLDVVDILLEKGADIESADKRDKTVFEVAFDRWLSSFVSGSSGNKDYYSIISLLLQKGAQLRTAPGEETVLHTLARFWSVEPMKEFLKLPRAKSLIDSQTAKGWTPLHVAAERNMWYMVAPLLDAEADLTLVAELPDGRSSLAIDLATDPYIRDQMRKRTEQAAGE